MPGLPLPPLPSPEQCWSTCKLLYPQKKQHCNAGGGTHLMELVPPKFVVVSNKLTTRNKNKPEDDDFQSVTQA